MNKWKVFETTPLQRFHFMPKRIIGFFLVVMVIIGVLLSTYGFRYGIGRWLTSQGADSVRIGWAHVNPLTGSVVLKSVRIQKKGRVVWSQDYLGLNLDLWDLFQKKITLEKAEITKMTLAVEQQADSRLRVGVITTAPAGRPEAAALPPQDRNKWRWNVKKSLFQDCRISFICPAERFEVWADQLRVQGLTPAGLSGKQAGIVFRGHLQDAPLDFTLNKLQFQPIFALSGRVAVTDLNLAGLAGFLKDPVQELSGAVSAQGAFSCDFSPDMLPQASYHGTVSLAEGFLNLGGMAQVSLGTLALDQCRLTLPRDGQIETVTIQDLSILLDGNDLSGDEKKPWLFLGQGRAHSVFWAQKSGLATTAVHLENLEARIKREKSGEFSVIRIFRSLNQALAKAREEKKYPQAKARQPSGTGEIQIDGINIAAGSRIFFTDMSPPEPFQARLTIAQFQAQNYFSEKITGRRQDQGGEGEPPPFTFQLQGLLADHATLAMKGRSTSVAGQSELSLQTRLSHYPATALSPYAADLLGYAIIRGQMNLTSALKLTDKRLKADNRFLFKKLKIKKAQAETAQSLNAHLHNLSLDTALSLLRDKQDHIKLDLPVTGDWGDLHFGLHDLAQKAIAKAVLKGATLYLKSTLGPYGPLISIGLGAAAYAFKVRLPPVPFQPGTASLAKAPQPYLAKLNEVLREKPELEVTIIGVATRSDLEARTAIETTAAPSPEKTAPPETKAADTISWPKRRQLLRLAENRARKLRNYMIDHYAIHPGRIFLEKPRLDLDPAATARAELGF